MYYRDPVPSRKKDVSSAYAENCQRFKSFNARFSS